MEQATKKAKLSPVSYQDTASVCFREVQTVLSPPHESSPSSSSSARRQRIGNSLERMKSFFDDRGFRTAIVQSPRKALSIYKDSCVLPQLPEEHADNHPLTDDNETNTKRTLLAMLGTHPQQDCLEKLYHESIQQAYCLWLYCRRIREACRMALTRSTDLSSLLQSTEQECFAVGCGGNTGDATADREEARRLSSHVGERVMRLIRAILRVDARIRPEQLQHEYERILWRNSTYANALFQRWLNDNDTGVKEIYFKHSHVSKYQRFTIYIYDSELDPCQPPPFVWMPCLPLAIQKGTEAVVQAMTRAFWSHLLQRGYFASRRVQKDVSPQLEKYFLLGISKDTTCPLLLKAHFQPIYPLCYYFCGKAGSGKSSLVRNFSYALNAALEDFVDPEIMVRSVKQNLNKPHDVLQLEFELRPNNNDLSVMSIIQGRRLTMGQSKPGLVVVDLEEMASNKQDADPNQLAVAQLISQRFSGRKGHYHDGVAPRNSANRGISGDASIIPLFTSNYLLEKSCCDALVKLHMFSNLKIVNMEAISGSERKILANEYLRQAIRDISPMFDPVCTVEADSINDNDDTRPLVRLLRMLAFYACVLMASCAGSCGAPLEVTQTKDSCKILSGRAEMILKVTPSNILVPYVAQVFDRRVSIVTEELTSRPEELSAVLEFWLARTLAPAVIVSRDRSVIWNLRKAVECLEDVHCIRDVDASQYKITRSLYDPDDTPNLRGDILKLGRGAFVVVELICRTVDAQLCIREIVEDTPSMTAFSSEKSALYKSGLLFCCYCEEEISPEIRSRASLLL